MGTEADFEATLEQPPVITLGEFLDRPVETPPILVEPGLVAVGAITVLTARGGKGKTTLSLNKLLRWAAGKPMFDGLDDALVPTRPLRSLVIENEGAPAFFQESLSRIVTRMDTADAGMARKNVLIWGDGGWSSMKLDNTKNLSLIRAAVEQHKPDIVFLEPMRGLWTGDENIATEMANLLDALNGLATQCECAVMLTHHERKGGQGDDDAMSAVRGSTALEGAAAVMERFQGVRGGQDQKELTWTKNRFAQPPPAVRMRFSEDTFGYELVDGDEVERAIIGFLAQFPGQYLSLDAIAKDTEEPEHTIRRRCKNLVEAGRLKVQSDRMDHGKMKWRVVTDESEDDL